MRGDLSGVSLFVFGADIVAVGGFAGVRRVILDQNNSQWECKKYDEKSEYNP